MSLPALPEYGAPNWYPFMEDLHEFLDDIEPFAPAGTADALQVPYRDESDTFRWGSSTEVVARALGWKIADDFGLDTTGATTHTAIQVQAWLDAGVAYGSGTIKCSGTVTITQDADLHLLTLVYTGTGTAVRVGDPASQLFRKTIQCPQVVAASKATTGWAEVAGSVGVQVANAYACSVTFPRVVGFETGVKITGVPIGAAIQGTQQCSFYPLHLDNNRVNWLVAPFVGSTQADSGWSNQNTVFGGRMTHNSSEGVQVSGAKHVEIASCPNTVNGWTFYGTSLESPNVVEYHVDTAGQYCTWSECRWENTGGDAARRIRSVGAAKGNRVRGGFNAGQLTQVISGGGLPFDTDTDVQMARRGGNTTTPSVLLENPVSSTAPVLTVMAAGAAAAASDPQTAWCVRSTSQQWAGKRSTDANARVIMDYLNGRVYVGDGTAAPVGFLGGSATALFVGGGVSFLPLSDSAQDLGNSGLKWRDLRLSRGIGVHGTAPPSSKPTVSGSRGGNAALASLLTALASYGLVTDSSTA